MASRGHILVVDDEKSIRALLRLYLTEAGYTVAEAGDGQAALSQVRQRTGISGEAEALDLVCGTTVGTNALLERRGGKVLLVTTAGFEDVLEIGRQARPKLYDLQFQKPPALVTREGRIGARERLAADGSVLTKLTAAEIRTVLRKARKNRPDALAICFLFSFRNAKHEASLAKALRHEGFLVSVSHGVRTNVHNGYQRISRAGNERLLAGYPNRSHACLEHGPPAHAIGQDTSPRDAVKWRNYFCGKRGGPARSNRSFRTGRWRSGRNVRGRSRRTGKNNFVRYGWNFH